MDSGQDNFVDSQRQKHSRDKSSRELSFGTAPAMKKQLVINDSLPQVNITKKYTKKTQTTELVNNSKSTPVLYNLDGNEAQDFSSWTVEEDQNLKNAVHEVGKDWLRISEDYFQRSRSSQELKDRYSELIRTRLVKGNWTVDEDDIIRNCMENGIKKWSEIANYLPGRTGKQCRERYCNHLDPEVHKAPWNDAEDEKLVELQKQYGNRWSEIARYMPGRSENNIKNRWNSANFRKKYKNNGYPINIGDLSSRSILEDNKIVSPNTRLTPLSQSKNIVYLQNIYNPRYPNDNTSILPNQNNMLTPDPIINTNTIVNTNINSNTNGMINSNLYNISGSNVYANAITNPNSITNNSESSQVFFLDDEFEKIAGRTLTIKEKELMLNAFKAGIQHASEDSKGSSSSFRKYEIKCSNSNSQLSGEHLDFGFPGLSSNSMFPDQLSTSFQSLNIENESNDFLGSDHLKFNNPFRMDNSGGASRSDISMTKANEIMESIAGEWDSNTSSYEHQEGTGVSASFHNNESSNLV